MEEKQCPELIQIAIKSLEKCSKTLHAISIKHLIKYSDSNRKISMYNEVRIDILMVNAAMNWTEPRRKLSTRVCHILFEVAWGKWEISEHRKTKYDHFSTLCMKGLPYCVPIPHWCFPIFCSIHYKITESIERKVALVQSGLTLSSPYHIETNELVSVDWFLYDKNLRHERVKEVGSDPKKCIQSQQ